MAVIYEDAKQNPWAGVGQGLQAVAGFVQQLAQAQQAKRERMAQQQVIAEKDPGKQADLAMRLLGPDKGGELVEQLTKAKMGPLALQKAQLDQQLETMNLQEKRETLKEMPDKLRLEQQKANADILAKRSQALEAQARAAGMPAEEAKNYAQAAEARAKAAQANSEMQAKAHFAQSLDQMLKGTATPDTVVASPNDPTKPAAVQPKHVASIMDFALGKSKNIADVDLPPVPITPSANKLHMTPEQLQEARLLAQSGDVTGAAKLVSSAGKITSRADVTLAPGFTVKMGYRDDGSSVQLAPPKYSPNKANLSVDSRTAQGIAAWNGIVNGIDVISKSGKTGNEATRILMDTVHKVAPWVDLKSVFGSQGGSYYDWKSQAAHALIAASGLMAGARGGQMLLKSLQDTIPKPNQPDSEVAANLRASRRVTDTMARNLFSSLVADGKAVPEELKEIIKAGSLDEKSGNQVSAEGLGGEEGSEGAKEGAAASGEGGRAGETGEGGGVVAGEGEGRPTGSGDDTNIPKILRYDAQGNLVQ